jgi:enoyl-CoA hydratase/carnithine racemase
MSTITVEERGDVAILRLSNGVTNVIGPNLVADLLDVLDMAEKAYRGLVLGGGTKFFSIGLNLPELLQFDRAAMDAFWDRFDAAVLKLCTMPLPTAAAIAGHATAGGTILALACDYRFVAAGRNLMGLNEVRIGLPVPYLADLMLRATVSERTATRIVYRGELIAPDQAKTDGLIDAVCPAEKLEKHAVEVIDELAAHSQPAFGLIKKNRVAATRHEFEKRRAAKKEEMLACWFRPEVQELLAEAALKF